MPFTLNSLSDEETDELMSHGVMMLAHSFYAIASHLCEIQPAQTTLDAFQSATKHRQAMLDVIQNLPSQ